MARIVLSDKAPKDQTIHFDLSGFAFELGGAAKKSVETVRAATISNAVLNEWLDVEYDAKDQMQPIFLDNQVDPQDDPFSSEGPLAANDLSTEAAIAAETAKGTISGDDALLSLAVEAGLDQNVAVVDAGIAQTIAADNSNEPAKSAAPFKTDGV